VLRAPLWQGAWGAIQTGIRYGVRHGYSAVITMDADGQHEPRYLPELIAAGRERRRGDRGRARAAARARARRAWAYFRLLTGLHFDDLTSGSATMARAPASCSRAKRPPCWITRTSACSAAAPREPQISEISGHDEPAQERRLAHLLLVVDGRLVHGRDVAAGARALDPAPRRDEELPPHGHRAGLVLAIGSSTSCGATTCTSARASSGS
jgi:hypothetical protein